jgi:DNA-directed RNA polymerase subunit RPC12/RpoP
MTDAQLDDVMRIVIRLKNYGSQQRCECGRLGYQVSQIYPDHTVYRCPRCGKILSATPQQIAQGVSLEKRLREDAERCRAEMEKYQIPHATKGRGAE